MADYSRGLTAKDICDLMEKMSIVALAELTGIRIHRLIDTYRGERGLQTLVKERAWGVIDPNFQRVINENNKIILQVRVVRLDNSDVYRGVIARPRTAWGLEDILKGENPKKYTMEGFHQPDWMPYSGAHWVSIWGDIYKENPYGSNYREDYIINEIEGTKLYVDLSNWLRNSISTIAIEGTGVVKSRDFDQGVIHGLTMVQNQLNELNTLEGDTSQR
jgi:hypothetical protein